MKNTIKDFIPLIRFDQISSNDFSHKILPFKKVFDKEVYEEIFLYYLSGTWQPKLLPQKGSRTGTGKLLTLRMKCLISSWIDHEYGLYDKNNLPYEFKLVYQGIKDGFSRSVFEQKCYNIEQTVTIIKIKDTGELVGGYNPVCWNVKGMPLDKHYWIKTDKSFIFKIDGNQLDNSILCRVKYPKCALYHCKQNYNVIFDDIKFHEILIDFNDLELNISVNNEPYCYYEHGNSFFVLYKNNLNLGNNHKKVHLLEECEVYKLKKS